MKDDVDETDGMENTLMIILNLKCSGTYYARLGGRQLMSEFVFDILREPLGMTLSTCTT